MKNPLVLVLIILIIVAVLLAAVKAIDFHISDIGVKFGP